MSLGSMGDHGRLLSHPIVPSGENGIKSSGSLDSIPPTVGRLSDESLLSRARHKSFQSTDYGMHNSLSEAMSRHNMDIDTLSNRPFHERMEAFFDTLHNKHRVTSKPKWWADIAAIVASLIALAGMIPAGLVILENESACDVSWLFLIFFLVSQLLWIVYSISYWLPINMIGAIVAGGLIVWMIFLKYEYDGIDGTICAQRTTQANTCQDE